MLATLPAVAVIPIEAGNLDIHAREMSVVHTFVNMESGHGGSWRGGLVRCRKVTEEKAPSHEPSAANAT